MLKRILGLLGWLGVALVFAALAAKYSPRGDWAQYSNRLAIAGLVCTLLYILSQWREILEAFGGRQARFGTLATVSVVVVLAILVAINYLGARRNKRWDLTAAKQFSLSDQTRKVLQDLKQPVHVRVFAAARSSSGSAIVSTNTPTRRSRCRSSTSIRRRSRRLRSSTA